MTGQLEPAFKLVFKASENRLETIRHGERSPFIARKAVCEHLAQKDAPMLGFLFGFNARLGRMHYFLSTIGLAVVMTAVCLVIAGYAIQFTSGRNAFVLGPDGMADDRRRRCILMDDLHAAVNAHQGYRVGPGLRHSGVDRDIPDEIG